MRLINPYQFGWFSTSGDKAAGDLPTAVNNSIRQGEIEAEIAFVFCNREPDESEESALFIKLVEDYHIPLICFSYQKFGARESTLIIEQAGTLPPWRVDHDPRGDETVTGL
ncbi:hypothetical protein ACFLWO_03750 [Chloroflexota bacterium]